MQGECDAWGAKRRPLEASLVLPVNFLAENGVLFIRRLIDIYGANLRLPRA